MVTSRVVEPTGVDVERASGLFAALADPTRVRILAVLADGSRCVCDIRDAVTMSKNLLSYHLRVLREAGLIEGSRRGRWIEYRMSDVAAGLIAGAVGSAGLAAIVERPPASSPWAACSTPSSDGPLTGVLPAGRVRSVAGLAGRSTEAVAAL